MPDSPEAILNDARSLAIQFGATNGDHAALLEAVAAALPHRASDPLPDPLTGFGGVGVVSDGSNYAGRVIVELWETTAPEDSPLIVHSADAPHGDVLTLVERVAVALPVRLHNVQKRRTVAE